MKKIASCATIVFLVPGMIAAPFDAAQNALKSVVDRYYEEEARTFEPIANSIYAQPYEDIVAIDQIESIQNMAQQLTDLVSSYGPDDLLPELYKFSVSSGYTLAIIMGAIVTYQLYKRVTRPLHK